MQRMECCDTWQYLGLQAQALALMIAALFRVGRRERYDRRRLLKR